jgi:tetratricopeptide (TPR) repeat protein
MRFICFESCATVRSLRYWAAVFLFILIPVCSTAQADASDARVQELYKQAKAAEAEGDTASAVANYESMLKIAPRLGAAYNNLGALYLRHGDYEKAADVLRKGLKVNPSMSSASALLGVALFEMGEYGEARPQLEAALRANPKDNNAELMLAKDLVHLQELEAAATHLQQLARREPQNSEVFYLLGQVHMQLSEKALKRLTEIDPNSIYVHEVSGDVMSGMKNYDGALLEYKKAVEMAPHQAGTHYKLGDAYWNLNEWDAATQQFQAELANDPNNCMARWKLGNILLQQRLQPEVALDDVNRALKLCPNLMQARVDRARALVMLNRNQEAIPELAAAAQADPQEPSVHFLLAQAYRAVGRSQDAQAEMKIFATLEESSRAAAADKAKQVLENKENAH